VPISDRSWIQAQTRARRRDGLQSRYPWALGPRFADAPTLLAFALALVAEIRSWRSSARITAGAAGLDPRPLVVMWLSLLTLQ